MRDTDHRARMICFAIRYPETDEKVAKLAQTLESYWEGRGAGSWLQGISPELIEHGPRTRAEAKRLTAKLGTG